jgi:hypothetical protein
MTLEFDEKGKIFTDVIRKKPLAATVQTTSHLIQGMVHVRQDERVKDELDRDELFLAMTDVSVFDMNGKMVRQAPFLAVRRSQIVWVIPEDQQDEV